MKETSEVYPGESYRTVICVMEIDKLREMTAQKNHRGNFELGKLLSTKCLGMFEQS